MSAWPPNAAKVTRPEDPEHDQVSKDVNTLIILANLIAGSPSGAANLLLNATGHHLLEISSPAQLDSNVAQAHRHLDMLVTDNRPTAGSA